MRSGADENPWLAPAPAVALSLGEPSGDQITVTAIGVTEQRVPRSVAVDDAVARDDRPSAEDAAQIAGRSHSSAGRRVGQADDCLGDLCCAQNYVALRPMWAPSQGDRGIPAQHSFSPVDDSRATCTARLVRHRPGLVSRQPNAGEHASLEFRAGLDVHVSRVERLMVGPQRDGRDVKPAEICCADESTIGDAAFPTGRGQHASSQMRLRAQRGTQHNSARNIVAICCAQHMATKRSRRSAQADAGAHDRLRPTASVAALGWRTAGLRCTNVPAPPREERRASRVTPSHELGSNGRVRPDDGARLGGGWVGHHCPSCARA